MTAIPIPKEAVQRNIATCFYIFFLLYTELIILRFSIIYVHAVFSATHPSIQGPLADVWVQCENPDCLKWRRITKEQSKALDESAPWFCCMNPNTAYQECSSPQEDFLQVEREARRVGIKFIASSLPPGSLVWATMAGFCR